MRALLTGASGFVGGHLWPALDAAGHDVRCATRRPDKARSAQPARTWVEMDLERPDSIRAALEGCEAAYYLVHGMGQRTPDYAEREKRYAESFLRAAEELGVSRIVYLGGVVPLGRQVSTHLASRQRTGEILRSGSVSCIELRAGMIIGAGSASWTMVCDLARRLPAMVLPRWLKNASHPLAVEDAVWALLAALTRPGDASEILEIPGPERVSHREVLERLASRLGHRCPMISVPMLSPKLSSYWIALITRVDLELASELVEGLRYDLDPTEDVLWERVDHQRLSVDESFEQALADESCPAPPSAHSVERLRSIGRRLSESSPW